MHQQQDGPAPCGVVSMPQPTFSDITMATAIAFSKFPVNATPARRALRTYRCVLAALARRPTFLAAYADRSSGVPELDNRP